MKAVFVSEFGGIEKLRYEDLPTPVAGPGQALVKIQAIGVNFIDIYYRIGLYQAPPPVILGMEAAGVVEAVGADVSVVKPGDRVAVGTMRPDLRRIRPCCRRSIWCRFRTRSIRPPRQPPCCRA